MLVTMIAALSLTSAASADAPVVLHLQDQFVDVNPCSGQDHLVTIDVTIYLHVKQDVERATHRITTSSGFVGRGSESARFDGAHFIVNDMLFNAATGEQIRAHLVVAGNPDSSAVLSSSVTCVRD